MTPPTTAQAAAAKAGGAGLWSGYLATKPNVGLARTWTRAEFEVARTVGGTPIGFCSGWDDPGAVKALAAQYNVRPCLDVETSIRPDGGWVPLWLSLSGAGLYGGYTVHRGRTAAFHVMSGYPAVDPKLTWPTDQPRPATPCGWQTRGTHSAFGASVDSGWYDDFFAATTTQGVQPVLDTNDALGAARITAVHLFGTNTASITANFQKIASDIQTLGWASALDKWEAMARSGGEQSDEQDIIGLQAEVKALQGAPPGTPTPVAPHTHPVAGQTGAATTVA